MPAKAAIQLVNRGSWIPAFDGMMIGALKAEESPKLNLTY